MTGKSKRVRMLEVLISLQSMLLEKADPYERRSFANKLEELKLEYRERTGHDYLPPIQISDNEVPIPHGYKVYCERRKQ